MIAPLRRPRAPVPYAPPRPRATWRASGKRIVAFKATPPGTTSAEFNRRPTP